MKLINNMDDGCNLLSVLVVRVGTSLLVLLHWVLCRVL
jgi:hypothetical protein